METALAERTNLHGLHHNPPPIQCRPQPRSQGVGRKSNGHLPTAQSNPTWSVLGSTSRRTKTAKHYLGAFTQIRCGAGQDGLWRSRRVAKELVPSRLAPLTRRVECLREHALKPFSNQEVPHQSSPPQAQTTRSSAYNECPVYCAPTRGYRRVHETVQKTVDLPSRLGRRAIPPKQGFTICFHERPADSSCSGSTSKSRRLRTPDTRTISRTARHLAT